VAEFRAQAEVPAGHPSLPGHFPGHPIVPGVLLLEYVLDAARAWRGPAARLAGLPAIKFLSPLQPAERFDIRLEDEGPRIRFTCSAGARLLAQGTLTLAADSP
jgi:3-hydroxyacyl-[acyl-carrier-protein] dehydratase